MKLDKDIKNCLKLILAFILFFAYPYIGRLFLPSLDLTSDFNYYLVSMVGEIIFIAILIFMYFKDLREQLKDFIKNFLKYMDAGFKYWMVGVAIMAISNLIINTFSTNGIAENQQSVQSIIELYPIIAFIFTTIFAPIVEEMVYRKAFKDVFKNKYLFILLSGLIFGGLHVISSFSSLYDLFYIIPYSSLGIAFAYTYYETNNIFTSIAYHAIHNGALTIISIIALQVGSLL